MKSHFSAIFLIFYLSVSSAQINEFDAKLHLNFSRGIDNNYSRLDFSLGINIYF